MLIRIQFTAAVLILLFSVTTTYSFHGGGVGPCEGCHTMHNVEGQTGAVGISVSPKLMRGADPSSICLNCHFGPGSPASYSVASQDGSAMTPGGDFYWLKKDFAWAGGSSPGYRHGHNIVAADFGFSADSTQTVAPGGTYPAKSLGCNSCHDPHGKKNNNNPNPISVSGSYGDTATGGTSPGNFRLLGGFGYDGGGGVPGVSFNAGAPVARANPVLPFGETDGSHVDYGSSMSEWCGNCHAGILNSHHNAGSDFEHPSGNNEHLETEMIDTYNRYVSTGDLSGTTATSYLALVPFERGSADPALLDPTSTRGPDANSNVMCLSCHRAHASAFRASARWDFDAQRIAESHPAVGDTGVSGNDVLFSYYGRDMAAEFNPSQGPFCEKCHGTSVSATDGSFGDPPGVQSVIPYNIQ